LSNHVSLLSALLTFRLVVFVKHTATTDTYTLSLHDALPISDGRSLDWWLLDHAAHYRIHALVKELNRLYRTHESLWRLDSSAARSEEHTSELQSRENLVCRLLLENKKEHAGHGVPRRRRCRV